MNVVFRIPQLTIIIALSLIEMLKIADAFKGFVETLGRRVTNYRHIAELVSLI